MNHDWRLVPLAVATWAAAWIGVSGWQPGREAVIACFVGLSLLGIVALRARRHWTAMLIAVFTLTLLMSGLQSWQRHHSAVAELSAEKAIGTVEDPIGEVVGAEPSTSGGSTGGQVNLNKATQSELESLPGVGPVTAQAIIAWRDENGSFSSVAELQEISGIGPKTFQKLQPLVTT